jgi:hypothetical protein
MKTTYINSSVKTTTLCDGWPRVLGQTATPVTLTFTDASVSKLNEQVTTSNSFIDLQVYIAALSQSRL